MAGEEPRAEESPPSSSLHAPASAWVRDTLAPHYTADGFSAGWKASSRTSPNSKPGPAAQADVEHAAGPGFQSARGRLFVQGQLGLPILVNARSPAAGPTRRSFRRTSPICRRSIGCTGLTVALSDRRIAGGPALRLGTTHMVNDIVIHHADGRRVPLITGPLRSTFWATADPMRPCGSWKT